ncbi:hypothetical protein EMPS_04520 [Entomortierella parvispora]|uniref:Uncharacterized protein n=1 Tax=Entomortierella parvispora TaxID=205924 RepID=A0A9P3H977_9FUNG|nr:hypothetical protein EMPS_04520 [Entomortierella parvispora]
MVNATTASSLAEASSTIHLDDETRKKEIVASLRGFLKHQTERVSLYKEFNDAFKEYIGKRMTQEEYATICRIVTEGFVELSVEILALEAHLAGTPNAVSTTDSNSAASSSVSQRLSLNSPEHAQLIRAVQLLEKEKLALTVQGQKWVLAMEEQKEQDQKDREEELAADRVIAVSGSDANSRGDASASGDGDASATVGEAEVEPTEGDSAAPVTGRDQMTVKHSVEEWQIKLDENRDRLNQVIEDINDKLADIQEAIAVIVL